MSQAVRKDFFSSWVLFFVAIPLSLGIAIASGVSPSAGLISAIVGGIVVGLLSGAPLVVTGPAAGLTIIVFEIIQTHGLKGLAIATVLAGIFQLAFAALRLGWIFEYVSKPVLEGMLAAIGMLIVASQLHILMGLSPPSKFSEQISTGVTRLAETGAPNGAHLAALALGVAGLLIQYFYPKIFRKWSWIPAAIPTVIILSIVAIWVSVPFVSTGDLTSSLKGGLETWNTSIHALMSLPLVLTALGLAVVASAETLLSARALDELCEKVRPNDKFPKSQLNRELFAQGIGNTLAGLIGGLPMTGVIVRSAVNVNAGAMSRKSAVFHGTWILTFTLLMPKVLEYVPLTALASILVFTGVKLLDPVERIRRLARMNQNEVVWWATFLAILGTNLLTGLVFGVVFSLVIARLSRVKSEPQEKKSEPALREDRVA